MAERVCRHKGFDDRLFWDRCPTCQYERAERAEAQAERLAVFLRWALDPGALRWPGKEKPCTECHCSDPLCAHDCELTRALSEYQGRQVPGEGR